MNIIRQSSISFIILAVALSSLIYGCSGGSASEPSFFNDNPSNNPGDNPSPPITNLLSNPPPPAPVITTAEATTSSVFLKWTDTSSREYGFIIVRDSVKIGETDRNISQYTDATVSPATIYTYTIVAWNKEGEGVSQAKLVTTPPLPITPPPINHSPTISSISATPASVETSKQSSVACQASDQDNDPLSYSWSASGGTISGSGSTIQWTAPASSGNYTVQCSVSDNKGESDAKSVNVAVTNLQPPIPPKINHPPAISSVSATPASVETSQQSSVTCQASDQDNDPLTYSWSANAGTISGSGSTVQWTAPIQAGTYTIQCSVSDGQGGSRSGVTDILVTDPVPVQTKWQLPSDLSIRSLATDQATGEVYAAGMTATAPTDVFLAKFNPDGTLAWEKRWGTAYYDLVLGDFLAISNGNAYVLCQCNDFLGLGGGNTRITVFNSQGDILRNIDLGDVGAESITADDSGAYVVYGENNISYIAKIDYQASDPIVWNIRMPGLMHAKAYDGAIYVISDILHKIDTNTGDVLQAVPRDDIQYGYFFDSSAIDASGVYVIGGGVYVPLMALKYSLDLTDISTSVFSTQGGLLLGASPALSDTSIYIAIGELGLFRFDKSTLEVKWNKALQDGYLGYTPVALLGDIILVARGNKFSRYDALTGELLP